MGVFFDVIVSIPVHELSRFVLRSYVYVYAVACEPQPKRHALLYCTSFGEYVKVIVILSVRNDTLSCIVVYFCYYCCYI